MTRICQVCGKKAGRGNKLEQRGKPKYLGGNGRKTTGKTKRHFYPNLQYVHAQTDDGTKRVRVCTKCIRSNKITKPVKRAAFSDAAVAAAATN